jgi:hypothetical protein
MPLPNLRSLVCLATASAAMTFGTAALAAEVLAPLPLPDWKPAVRGALPDGPKFNPNRLKPPAGDVLNIESLTTPPEGFRIERRNNFYKLDGTGGLYRWAASGHFSNYQEDPTAEWKKSVPDPLKMRDGRPVTTADMWRKERRPEVVRIMETYIYGKVPDTAPKVVWTAGAVTEGNNGGIATLSRTATGRFVNPDGTPFTPPAGEAGRGGFGGGGAGGGLTVSYTIPANAPGRVPLIRGGNLQSALAMGFGVVNINGSAPNVRSSPPADDDWGAIRKTAWVVSKGLDYLETDPLVDAQIAVTGHSIGGKQALVAAAFDERVRVCFASCSGLGGAQMARHDWGETIDDVAQLSPQNYCNNLQYWVSRYNDMPFDAHFLIALMAPRPLLATGGTQDLWSDPVGAFWSVYYASPVYQLLGEKGIDAKEPPAPDTFIGEGTLVFHDHVGGHMPMASENAKYAELQKKYMKVLPKAP